MPTQHRRISVVCDAELTQAIAAAQRTIRARSQAAALRELALIGARSLADATDRAATALVDDHGARPARGDLIRAAGRALAADDVAPVAEAPSDSLAWVRGPR